MDGIVKPEPDPKNNEDIHDSETPAIKMSPESCVPQGMTLEAIVDLSGEMEHLNELVMLHIEKEGGFTTPASYFALVQPILDLLNLR